MNLLTRVGRHQYLMVLLLLSVGSVVLLSLFLFSVYVQPQNSCPNCGSQTSGARPTFACAKYALKPGSDTTFVNGNFDVWFVPMDDTAYVTLKRIQPTLEQRLKIRTVVEPCFSPSLSHFDATRRQFVAQGLIQATQTEYPVDVNVGQGSVIALTSNNMYIREFSWDKAFAYRPMKAQQRIAVVSSYHMSNGLDPFTQADRFDARLRKMLMKNIAIVHFGMSENNNPKTVLYNDLHTVEAIDKTEERLN